MRFSIITPSYRNDAWLKLCIASVADQGVAHEHIVHDAGSDDGTLNWLLQDRRVQVHVEKDAGMYDGLNRGLRKSQGDILACLNCDEQLLPGALASILSFFQNHPRLDVVFADAVVVDTEGDYLWHRKALLPLRRHTAMFPLSTLSCATFFRRRIVSDQGLYFDAQWRYCGDGDWVSRLIDARVPMAVLRSFTSVFTHTGNNLSLDAKVEEEDQRRVQRAPWTMKAIKPAVLLHHRLRRLLRGIYWQKPFTFSLYTRQSPTTRVDRFVARPTSRWRW